MADLPQPRGRLAPSPTGALHLGNARTFLITWLSIRSRNGSLVLRMEDLDHPKVKPQAQQETLDDLHWLGLDWDEGPDLGGPFSPYVQSRRVEFYREALHLLQRGNKVYPCVCSRRDMEAAQSAPHKGDDGPAYTGVCDGRFDSFEEAAAALPNDRVPGWRFRATDTGTSFMDGFHGRHNDHVATSGGDFVLARHPDGAGYTLAVVVDDAAMRISEVVRGDDLLPATHRQLLVYDALGLDPPKFVHVPLVVAEDGRRLAKRHGDTRLSAIRKAGISPECVIGLLAHWCGWAEWGETLTADALLARYSLETVPDTPAVLTAGVKAYLRVS